MRAGIENKPFLLNQQAFKENWGLVQVRATCGELGSEVVRMAEMFPVKPVAIVDLRCVKIQAGKADTIGISGSSAL
jgi:hypothetical protein